MTHTATKGTIRLQRSVYRSQGAGSEQKKDRALLYLFGYMR